MVKKGKNDESKIISYKKIPPLSDDLNDQFALPDQGFEEGIKGQIDKRFYDQFPSKDDSLRMEFYYKGLLNKAVYEEATSKLIPVDHVREFLTLIGSKTRTLLTQLPDRLSPRISHESDEETIHLLISREIEHITNSIIEETSEDKLHEVLSASARNPVIKSKKISQSHKG